MFDYFMMAIEAMINL